MKHTGGVGFKETEVKQSIRLLLRGASTELHRPGMTYLGLPGETAADLRVLNGLIERAICIDRKADILDEMRCSVSSMPLKETKFLRFDMWHYLRDAYPSEKLVADVTFLDFYGGGITKDDPFSDEIAGLRSYFAKQAQNPNTAFVFAWTYMPHDQGKAKYISALEKFGHQQQLDWLRRSTGVSLRSRAIRLLLWQSLQEHKMLARVVQHLVYKSTMNALIIIYGKGKDDRCSSVLQDPGCLLSEGLWVYEYGIPAPRYMTL